jgi:NitT/TauT family transport system substrate-binding protein
MRRAGFLAATLALPALPALPAVAQSSLTPLRIAVIPGDISAEAYYARDLGTFRKAGIDAQISPLMNGPAISTAIAAGAIDVGFGNVISIAVAHDRGIPQQIVAPANIHTTAIPTAGILVVPKDSPLKTARDLNGKVIAVSGLANIADLSVCAYVDKNGGDSRTVKFVEMRFAPMVAAVLSGKVDAALIDAANEQHLEGPNADLRLLTNTFDAVSPRFSPAVWFASATWTEKNVALTKSFVAIMAETATWANEHHAESAAILAANLSKPVSDILAVRRVPYGVKMTPDLVQPSIDLSVKYLHIAPFPAQEIISLLAR